MSGETMEDYQKDVAAAFKEVKAEGDARAEWDESKEDREYLESLGKDKVDLGEMIDAYVKWDESFRRDPFEASVNLSRKYAMQPPAETKPERPKETPPEYLDEDGRIEWQRDADIRDAIRNPDKYKKEDSKFQATAAQRAALKKAFPESTFAGAIKRIVEIDRDMRHDPVGTSRRLAARYGAPITREHAEKDVREAHLVGGLTAAINGMVPELPELKRADVQAEMTRMFKAGEERLTGDFEADVARSYSRALQNLAPKKPRERKANLDDDIYADAEDAFRAHR